ncbi:hypothetical protein HPB48_009570 [Haemaphysalis longicornis]|uniref:ATPase AAA-type core domain-containing protein n=1 Tax=Haemaphysalis longicornis TaxID=44386 RepID=A0A9J6FCM8_HAELO|nr:hypothetical protein HPB48_009570 [Haemaphysalis longicornis]
MTDIPALAWNVDADLGNDACGTSTEEIICKTKMPGDQIRFIKGEIVQITDGIQARKQKIQENSDKIKANEALPYLVSSIVELLDVDPLEGGEEDGARGEIESKRKGEGAGIKSFTRQTSSSPFVGLVHADKLCPGLNKGSFVTLPTRPQEYDSRVEAVQEDEWPSEQYSDIGGLDKQPQELVETMAIVLPMTHKDKVTYPGITPLQGGGLLYWPPEIGRTLVARACATQTQSTFLKRAGTPLGQMSIGERATQVRDSLAPAKQRAPAVILTGGLDAIGNERFDSEKAGDREMQHAMLELLSPLERFSSSADIVMVATDQAGGPRPALLRWCRQDWTMEFPHADADACTRIMQIHSRKMKFYTDANFEDLDFYIDEVQRDAVQDRLPRG